MKIPVDKLTRAFKMGASVKKDSDTPVRVSVYLDPSASRFLADGKHCRRPEFLGRKERPNVL